MSAIHRCKAINSTLSSHVHIVTKFDTLSLQYKNRKQNEFEVIWSKIDDFRAILVEKEKK